MKYTWTHEDMDNWYKEQAKKLKERGIKAGPSDVTKLLHDMVLRPNNVDLVMLFQVKPIKIDKPKPVLKRRNWRKKKIF